MSRFVYHARYAVELVLVAADTLLDWAIIAAIHCAQVCMIGSAIAGFLWREWKAWWRCPHCGQRFPAVATDPWEARVGPERCKKCGERI
jgi:hypothetical protein